MAIRDIQRLAKQTVETTNSYGGRVKFGGPALFDVLNLCGVASGKDSLTNHLAVAGSDGFTAVFSLVEPGPGLFHQSSDSRGG